VSIAPVAIGPLTLGASAPLLFIGGPCVPVWPQQPPAWLPPQHTAAVGRVDGGSEPKVFGATYNGVLMGGNAVMRRSVLEKVGLFRPVLGPRVNQRLLSCEDEDLYLRLLDSGAVGWYLPDLMVLHHVQPERLTKTYHRQWCFWHGVSKAMLHVRRPPRVRELGGSIQIVSSLGRGTRIEIHLPRSSQPEVLDGKNPDRGRSRDRSDGFEASA